MKEYKIATLMRMMSKFLSGVLAILLISTFVPSRATAQDEEQALMEKYVRISEQYRLAEMKDSVLHYSSLALQHYRDEYIMDDSVRCHLWIKFSGAKIELNQPDSARYWLLRAVNQLEQTDTYPTLYVDALTNLGLTYVIQFENEKGIEYLASALDVARRIRADDKRARILNNLGICYRRLNREAEAIGFYEEALSLRRESRDTIIMANILHNMALALMFMERFDKAEVAIQEAISLCRAKENRALVPSFQVSLARCFLRRGHREEAQVALDSALASEQLKLDAKSYSTVFLVQAELDIADGKYKDASHHLDKISDLVSKLNALDVNVRYNDLRSQVAAKSREYEQAFSFLNKKAELSEQYSVVQNKVIRREAEERFLSKEKNYEISLLEADKKLLEINHQSARKANLFLGLIVALLASVVLVGIYFLRKVSRQKKEISQANADKELLLKEIHHRVKNNLQVVSSLLTLQSKFIKDDNVQRALVQGNTRLESMALIHKDLYQHDNLKGVHAPTYFEKLLEGLLSAYEMDELDLAISQEVEDVWIDVDTMVPLGLMSNELLTNVFKHAFVGRSQGSLRLSLKQQPDVLELLIEDDGRGMTDDDMRSNNSFGHSLVKAFVRKLDATMTMEHDHGTSIKIEIRKFKLVQS